MGGTYLNVLHCLGAALGIFPGGVMDFSTVDASEMGLETGSTLTLVNLNVVLAALQTLQHMLDFKSSVSCFGFL